MNEVTQKAAVLITDIEKIIATGVNRAYVTLANQEIAEPLCLAQGINLYLPTTQVLLDIGAQKSLAVKCNSGKVSKWVTSGKCAASTITYLQIVVNTLKLNIHNLDELFFKSKEDLEIQSTCAVFAETEIISLVHSNHKPEDIVRAVFRGLAGRLYSQLLEIGLEGDLTVVGGIAKSKAMIAALEEKVGSKIQVPENPEIISALGAAIIAHENRNNIP